MHFHKPTRLQRVKFRHPGLCAGVWWTPQKRYPSLPKPWKACSQLRFGGPTKSNIDTCPASHDDTCMHASLFDQGNCQGKFEHVAETRPAYAANPKRAQLIYLPPRGKGNNKGVQDPKGSSHGRWPAAASKRNTLINDDLHHCADLRSCLTNHKPALLKCAREPAKSQYHSKANGGASNEVGAATGGAGPKLS